MNKEEMMEILNDSESLIADGFDDCIIGIAERCSKQPLCVYDREKVIDELIDDGMSEEEAIEYFNYNIVGAWVGEGTPLFLTKLEDE